MKQYLLIVLAIVAVLFAAGCGEEAKIEGVKKTILPNCSNKTMLDLTSGLLEKPVWGYVKQKDGKQFVTVNGTLAGDKLPAWVKDQKLLDITFRFALDPKTDKYNPAELDGFPSLTSPEGVLQAYKVLLCK